MEAFWQRGNISIHWKVCQVSQVVCIGITPSGYFKLFFHHCRSEMFLGGVWCIEIRLLHIHICTLVITRLAEKHHQQNKLTCLVFVKAALYMLQCIRYIEITEVNWTCTYLPRPRLPGGPSWLRDTMCLRFCV